MWNSGCSQTMVSVSSITEQLCKQKLEDGWSNSESEKKSVLSVPGCLVSESDIYGVSGKAKVPESAKISTDSKFNNNVSVSGKKKNESDVSKDTKWHSGQIEQMPPKKKHRRSFSIPGETKYESGSGFRRVQLSQSSLDAAILCPVAVRPCIAAESHSASKVNKVTVACEDLPELKLDSDYSFPISGPSSGFYGNAATSFAVADLFQSEHCQSRVAVSNEPKVESRTTFRLTKTRSSDAWGSFEASNDLLSSPDVSSARSMSSTPSNSDLRSLCPVYVINPCQHQTPERKTGLKRRHDEDRPKLDFFKMIETAYENESFSSSISQQLGSNKRCSKDDVSLSSLNQAQNVDSSSPCLHLDDSNDPSRTSPASPFISLHHHFLAEKMETRTTGDDDMMCFTNHNAAINCRDRLQKNWTKKTKDNQSSEGNRVVRDDRVIGSEFDLDLIENN